MAAVVLSAGASSEVPPAGHVHFDDSCVLIPDPVLQSRKPRLVKKSYSLPLWRKRSNFIPPADVADAMPGPASPTEDRGVVITVSVPSFSRSRSLSRSENMHQPLVPCIVNPNGITPPPRTHIRRPSLPLPPRPDAVTVPLRPCCRECYPAMEESLKKGVAWEEKFTRGARRLRNASADMLASARAHRHRRVQDDIPGFSAVVSVDEVDKRHGLSSDNVVAAAAASGTGTTELRDPEQELLPSLARRLQISDEKTKTRGGPIVEVDEAELSETGFPLPSPRRTPADSPSASSSHLPRDARDDNVRLLLQAVSDASTLEHVLTRGMDTAAPPAERAAPPPDDTDDNRDEDIEAGDPRASVYYTPDSSPAIPAFEPSSIVSSPDSPTPNTPLTPHPIASARYNYSEPHSVPHSAPIPIPAASPHAHTLFSGFASHPFEGLHTGSPPSTSPPPPPPPKDVYHPRYSMSGSPDLADLPVLPSCSPPGSARKRAALHVPHLPRAGSFLRAGAEMLKGVSSLGAGSGTVMAV